jgi:hypothetical protein
MSTNNMATIILGNIQHELRPIIYYYGCLIAVSLPENGSMYAVTAFASLKERYKDIETFESDLHSVCIGSMSVNYKENELPYQSVPGILQDLSTLYRHFELYPLMKDYIINNRNEPTALIEDIRNALMKAKKESVLQLYKKILETYKKMSPNDFAKMRNEIYKNVIGFITL